MNKALALIIAAVCTLVGCTTFTPTVNQNSSPDSVSGYVFGRFVINTYDSIQTGLRLRMGMVLTSQEGGKIYNIEFVPGTAPRALAVAPGTYRLSSLVFATADYGSQGDKPIPPDTISGLIRVQPGKAYYLGDFVGSSGVERFGIQYGVYRYSRAWKLESISNNLQQTTAEFRSTYPELARLEIIDTMLPTSPAP